MGTGAVLEKLGTGRSQSCTWRDPSGSGLPPHLGGHLPCSRGAAADSGQAVQPTGTSGCFLQLAGRAQAVATGTREHERLPEQQPAGPRGRPGSCPCPSASATFLYLTPRSISERVWVLRVCLSSDRRQPPRKGAPSQPPPSSHTQPNAAWWSRWVIRRQTENPEPQASCHHLPPGAGPLATHASSNPRMPETRTLQCPSPTDGEIIPITTVKIRAAVRGGFPNQTLHAGAVHLHTDGERPRRHPRLGSRGTVKRCPWLR